MLRFLHTFRRWPWPACFPAFKSANMHTGAPHVAVSYTSRASSPCNLTPADCAIPPSAPPAAVFASIGRVVWRDVGPTAICFRLLMKVCVCIVLLENCEPRNWRNWSLLLWHAQCTLSHRCFRQVCSRHVHSPLPHLVCIESPDLPFFLQLVDYNLMAFTLPLSWASLSIRKAEFAALPSSQLTAAGGLQPHGLCHRRVCALHGRLQAVCQEGLMRDQRRQQTYRPDGLRCCICGHRRIGLGAAAGRLVCTDWRQLRQAAGSLGVSFSSACCRAAAYGRGALLAVCEYAGAG